MAKVKGRPREIEEGKRLSVVLSQKQIEQVRLAAVEMSAKEKRPVGVSEALRRAVERAYSVSEKTEIILSCTLEEKKYILISAKKEGKSVSEYLLTDLRKKGLKERLEKSIQQSKEGKVKSRGSFAGFCEDEI